MKKHFSTRVNESSVLFHRIIGHFTEEIYSAHKNLFNLESVLDLGTFNLELGLYTICALFSHPAYLTSSIPINNAVI